MEDPLADNTIKTEPQDEDDDALMIDGKYDSFRFRLCNLQYSIFYILL